MIDFDFHIHCAPYSTCATQSVEQAVQQAYDAGARMIAICNHDTFDGLEEARSACQKRNMTLINGVELSVSLKGISDDLEGKVIHLLGYNFELQRDLCAKFFQDIKAKYAQRILRICNYLRGKGYVVTDCERMKELRCQLVDKGYFPDEKAAKAFLHGDEIAAYFPEEKLEPQTAIEFIHKIGGTVFWAHPNRAEGHVSLTKEQIAKIVEVLCEKGLDGIEVFHPDTVNEEGMVEYLLSIADERGLKVTLGSDTHHILDKEAKQYFILNEKLKSYGFDFNKIKNIWE